MNKLSVSPYGERKIQAGQTLLEANFFQPLSITDCLVELYSIKGQFLGGGYLSSQNKGVGWLVSRQKERIDRLFLEKLFQEAKKKRTAFFSSEATNAFRLFNQDGDGFGGFTVDLYQDYVVFSWYNAFVYAIKDDIVTAFRGVFPEILGGYEKIRFKGLDYESAPFFGQEAPDAFSIVENGVAYEVFLNDGLMTGIFLDQHAVRGSLVEGLAKDKTVLNMFSYTAAFSVAAAVGGAKETTSVDLAKRSRELSEAHFRANNLSLDEHRFVVMDVFDYFKYAKRHGLSFDVIIIDPPSFARNKKQTFSVAKDYHKLVKQALEILEPNGHLILSTNAANLSLKKFKKEIEKGLGDTPHQFLKTDRLPDDFVTNKNDESSNYLKVFTIQVSK